jgi:hypothetical protein
MIKTFEYVLKLLRFNFNILNLITMKLTLYLIFNSFKTYLHLIYQTIMNLTCYKIYYL